ncbi:MAG: TetR/AcrR family transcriptional regulator [Chitinophagaceae bacterium]|nr:TetR/AcrR family transcriptional regulator [Chitinophagaceae bacterium]
MKFTPRSETTRQFIIETTAGIFNQKGYAGTSMSDLTEATKLTKGSIYGNFENKEEVALAAFEYNQSLRVELLTKKVNSCKTYKEKLMVHIGMYDGTIKHQITPGGCPLMNTAIEADDTHEGLRKKAAEGLVQWKKALAALIKGGIAAKEFKKDTDANQLALSLLALIEGAILIGKATKNINYLHAILDNARNQVELICIKKSK